MQLQQYTSEKHLRNHMISQVLVISYYSDNTQYLVYMKLPS